VAVLIADASRAGDAETICRTLRGAAPYCRIHAATIDPVSEFGEGSAHRAHGISAALRSDVVLYLAAEIDRKGAALIALRERAGFTLRLTEPEAARAWYSTNRRRSLYVLGALPGAFGALALALELGCADAGAAQRVRERSEYSSLIAV
jgi:hypothetical protein